jgi:hypothetical protein
VRNCGTSQLGGGKMYLITAYFDEKTNRTLQRYLDLVAEKTGNTFMTANQVPPHMTISSVEARSAEVLREPFIRCREKIICGNIRFVSIGQLLPYVFYTTPVLNEYLQELSKQIYQAVRDIPETSVNRYYRPGSWLPHVTLGKTLTREQMQAAFEVMQDNFQPFDTTVTEIGLAKVNPHEDVERFQL